MPLIIISAWETPKAVTSPELSVALSALGHPTKFQYAAVQPLSPSPLFSTVRTIVFYVLSTYSARTNGAHTIAASCGIGAGDPVMTKSSAYPQGALGPVGTIHPRRDSWYKMGRAKASRGIESCHGVSSLTSKLLGTQEELSGGDDLWAQS